GVLRQGTPFYAEYRARPLVPLEAIITRFSGERAQFLQEVFARAKKGREWYTLALDQIAPVLNQERQRLVRALEYLAEQGLLELQVAGVRQRFTRLVERPDVTGFVADLMERFTRREQQEVARVQHVIDLIQHAGCQTYALLRYFGEEHRGNCG